MTEVVSTAPAPPLSRSLVPLLLISLAALVGFAMMQSFGIMAESAKAELHLSDSALAVVQGVSAAIPLVLFSIPIGIWVDRWNRVFILIIMAICWTGCSVGIRPSRLPVVPSQSRTVQS